MLMWTKPGAYTHIQKQAACHWVRPHHFPPQYHHIPPHSHIAADKESHTPQIRTTLPHTTALYHRISAHSDHWLQPLLQPAFQVDIAGKACKWRQITSTLYCWK